MKEKIEKCYDQLQTVTIMATKKNLETMLNALYELEDIYKQMTKGEADHAGEKGQASDPG